MHRHLLLFAVLVLLIELLHGTTEKYRLSYRSDPSTSIVVGWNQKSGSNPLVYYDTQDHGTNWQQYAKNAGVSRSVSAKGMNNRFARITGLTPDTKYYFIVRDSQGSSKRFWFITAPDAPKAFTVVAGGDSRNNQTARRNANKMVAKLRPLFVMFGGDYTGPDTDVTWQTWMDDWQLTTGSDGRMIPIIAARGNHENSNQSVSNLFDTPHASIFYALSFGGTLLRVYTLNSEISTGGSQKTWLSTDLGANSSTTWKFAQYHKPVRPHVAKKVEGTGQYSNWAGLFYQYGVQLVVEADAHTVKSTWPIRPFTGTGSDEGFIRDDIKGTVYVGEGCWGAPLRTNDDNKTWTRDSGKFNQFKWLFVYPSKVEIRTVQVDYVNSSATVNDANPFTLPAGIRIWKPSQGDVITLQNSAVPLEKNPATPEKVGSVDNPGLSLQPIPMRSSVTISLGGSFSGSGTVSISNFSGTLIRELTPEKGKARVIWDGADAFGSRVHPGIYMYSLTRHGGVESYGTIMVLE